MPNIGIIAQDIRSNVNQAIRILIITCMSNIGILNQAILNKSCLQGFLIAITVESKRGHNLVNISRNLSGHPNIDPKSKYAKYQNPSLSASQDCFNGRAEKAHNSVNISQTSLKR